MTSKNKIRNCSIVTTENLIRATRDSGYKSTASAVSELVDNSIQAEATSVKIRVFRKDHSDQIVVEVTDNGCGMAPFTLRQALRLGGSSRFNDRSGLGRFGMGLPNSSLSQAKRLTVTSWTHLSGRCRSRRNGVGSGKPIFTWLDADEIANGTMTEVPPPRIVQQFGTKYQSNSGTIVHWSNCDRLEFRRVSTICRHLTRELSRRFRNFIAQGVVISVNNNDISPVDPLFVRYRKPGDRAVKYGKGIRYRISSNPHDPSAPAGTVEVRFSELPVKKWGHLDNHEKKNRGITNKAGVSVLRAGREIDSGWFFLGKKRRENYDDWWRCEIHFEPILDEAFGLTHTKQQIQPQQYLLEALCPDIETTARVLNSRARTAHSQLNSTGKLKHSEKISTNRSKFLKPVAGIQSIATKKRTSYKIRICPTKNSMFYSFRLHRGALILTLDPDHAFYRELYAPLTKSASLHDVQTLIELTLFSAARSEVALGPEVKETLDDFRQRWSETIETLIGG